jgi:hypothetical protein
MTMASACKFLYLNSAFAPSPDASIAELFKVHVEWGNVWICALMCV